MNTKTSSFSNSSSSNHRENNNNNINTGSLLDESSSSISQSHSRDSQTRFSFYTASTDEQQQQQHSPSPPNRFQYYHPGTMNEQSSGTNNDASATSVDNNANVVQSGSSDSSDSIGININHQIHHDRPRHSNDSSDNGTNKSNDTHSVQTPTRSQYRSSNSNNNSVTSAISVDTLQPDATMQPSWFQARTPPEADRLLRSRDRNSDAGAPSMTAYDIVAGIINSSSGRDHAASQNNNGNYNHDNDGGHNQAVSSTRSSASSTITSNNNNNDDDSYQQAEFVARRKSRQQRMARYVDRLSQLKQDDSDDNNPSNSNSNYYNSNNNGVPQDWQSRPKNVEDILLAVLERASSSNSGCEEKKISDTAQTEAVIAAMSDLVLKLSESQSLDDMVSPNNTLSTRNSYYSPMNNHSGDNSNNNNSSPHLTERYSTTRGQNVDDQLDKLVHEEQDSSSDDDDDKVFRDDDDDDDNELEEVATEVFYRDSLDNGDSVQSYGDKLHCNSTEYVSQQHTKSNSSEVDSDNLDKVVQRALEESRKKANLQVSTVTSPRNKILTSASTTSSTRSSPRHKKSGSSGIVVRDEDYDELDKVVNEAFSDLKMSEEQHQSNILSVSGSRQSSTFDKYNVGDAAQGADLSNDEGEESIEDSDFVTKSDLDEHDKSGESSALNLDDDDDDDDDLNSMVSDGDFGEDYDDDDDDDDDDIDMSAATSTDAESSKRRSSVLGPLSRKSGGTTGVVLDTNSGSNRNITSPSILDSMSAVVNLVAGQLSPRENGSTSHDDSYSDDDVDQSNELMRNLCAHLLPHSVNHSTRILDTLPVWDDSNPDEPGYRIVRLSRTQLDNVEKSYEKLSSYLKSDHDHDTGKNGVDDAFERDLKAAEDLLDMEEKRLQAAENKLNDAEKTGTDDQDAGNHSVSDSDCLSSFPGVKPTGKGEMGDLEFFQLPIIFKSHVTGFEPTKDLYLEQGNIIAGQYLVERELGSAAFSTAYRCVDLNSEGDGPDDHDEVCLKVIKNTKDFFDQSLDEIKILELLRQTGKCHENCIIEMRSFFYYREHLFIVTELLRQNLFEFGRSIIENNEEPYFTLPRLAYITRQCLIALKFVHELGLVHSDIKPENILLASYSRARIKVIDFGSSCYLTDRQSSYIQSRSYRAPEVVLGLPYDGRIDIWSLGCVVAEMFTGEVTFQNDSVVSMLSRIESICGAFPRHMVTQGRQSDQFFTKCGLLFESVNKDHDDSDDRSDNSDDDDDEEEVKVDIFQPKITCLASRLGFSPELMELYDGKKKMSKEEKRQGQFVDFVRKLLAIDPEKRPTAAEALSHPWIRYAASLTEDDIIYPSS